VSGGSRLYRVGRLVATIDLPPEPLLLQEHSGVPDLVIHRVGKDRIAGLTRGDGVLVAEDGALQVRRFDTGHLVTWAGWFDAFATSDLGEILVYESEPSADLTRVVVSTVLPIMIGGRGLECLHASAVEIEGAAVMFTGSSGTGKSTLATALCRSGARLLADDLAVISVAGGERPAVMASSAVTRLAHEIGSEMGAPPPVGPVDPLSKQPTPSSLITPAPHAAPLVAVYLLEHGSGPKLTPLSGTMAVVRIARALHSTIDISPDRHAVQFGMLTSIASTARLKALRWTPSAQAALALAQPILADVQETASGAPSADDRPKH